MTSVGAEVEEARQRREWRRRREELKVLDGCRSFGRKGRKFLEAAITVAAAAVDAIETLTC